MKLFYRLLTAEDIPAIKDISKDIWKGDDYIPQVIENWLQDKNCMNYGTFLDEKREKMVGFGRVKLFDKEIAWLEGGRVKAEYQKQGIGREMLKYAIDYASSVEAKIAQYDTSSKNLGSVTLAKRLGFKRKKSMNVLQAKREEIKSIKPPSIVVRKILAVEAKEHYKNFDIGAGNEISMGWNYKPLKYISDEDGEWYVIDSKAILQKIKFKSISVLESPEEREVWLIIYGKPKNTMDLINFVLQKEFRYKGNKTYVVFCSSDKAVLIEDLGFSYNEGEPFAVVLYEKSLK
jgi:RimJ/RimL family protein N-acetyltransferase